MRDAAKAERQEAIEVAAYALLAEKGYLGMSMLAVARRAKASNETLYNWYGDKLGLCRALVTRNANAVREVLEAGLSGDRPGLDVLRDLAAPLLTLLLSDHAIALNRAAAADASGALGAALSAAGREAISPLIGHVMRRARRDRALHFENVGDTVELYVALLVGDWQIRRVIGQLPQPNAQAIAERADLAMARFCRLMQPDQA